jgi:hypothetical protein
MHLYKFRCVFIFLCGIILRQVLERGLVILATADRELHPGLEGAAAERQV